MSDNIMTTIIAFIIGVVILGIVGVFAYTANQGYERDQVIRLKCTEAGGVWASSGSGYTCQWGKAQNAG